MHTLELDLVPVGGSKKPQWSKLAKLLFTNFLSPGLRNRIKYVPRTSHTNSLGWLEHSLERQVAKLKGPFDFTFDPDKEYALSAAAGLHWTTLALATMFATRPHLAKWFNAFDIDWRGPTFDLPALLGSSDVPLVEVLVDKKPFLVGVVRGKPGTFVFDVDVGPQSLGALSKADVARLAAAASSGRCECFLCENLRPKFAGARKLAAAPKPKPKRAAPSTKPSRKKLPLRRKRAVSK